MATAVETQLEAQIKTQFKGIQNEYASENAQQKSLRAEAIQFIQSKGFPTRKVEEWKYTSVKNLLNYGFTFSVLKRPSVSSITLNKIKQGLNPHFLNLVFINGELNTSLSNLDQLPKELHFSNEIPAIQKADFQDAFEAMSLAFAGQGFSLKVEKDFSLHKPLCVVHFVSLEGGSALAVLPQLRIELGAGSKISLIEHYMGTAGERYLLNGCTQVHLLPQSKMHFARIQDESMQGFHIGHSEFSLEKGAELKALSLSLGSQLSRHHLEIFHNQEESHSTVNGLYILRKEQHSDHYTEIHHKVGSCVSLQKYKGILDGESRGIFNGRIVIDPQAQKAYSEQLNNNLLLSNKAEVDSKPQLEIFADDVKATHGSTVGALNPEEVFYLQSRGLSKKIVLPLLCQGFITELINEVEEPSVREYLNNCTRRTLADLKITDPEI